MPVDQTFNPLHSDCFRRIEEYDLPIADEDNEASEDLSKEEIVSKRKEHITAMHICRQIRGETMKFYFSSNTFVLWAQPDSMRITKRWLDHRDNSAFDYMRKVAFWSERHCCVPIDDSQLLSVLDLPTLTLQAIELSQDCKLCQKAHADLVEVYNKGDELNLIRAEGGISTMLGRDRKELLVKVMEDIGEIESGPPCIDYGEDDEGE